MPWFPEFTNAVELARLQTRAAGQADPAGQYLRALNNGDPRALEDVWPGEVVIYDPRAGEIRGHKRLKQFISQNQSWMAQRHVRTDIVAATCAEGRAVVELLAHLTQDGQDLAWPVAVVAESPDDRSVVFRTYCSSGQWTDNATSGLPSSSPGGVAQAMSSAATTPPSTSGTPRR